MDDLTRFEERFEERVRTFARAGSMSVDSAAVAHAVATGHPRRGANSRWLGRTPDRRTWTIALALGLLAAMLGGALLIGGRLLLPPRLTDSPTVTNGWIAFTVGQPGPDGQDEDSDIWLVAFDRDARRVVGSETDRVDELCPAFSPDGRSLAYGRVEGHGTDYFVNADGTEGSRPPAYRQSALVIADVSDDGRVSDHLLVDVGDGLPPPCPIWSPDGSRVAFGVNRTSPINPTMSAAGSEVWIVTVAGARVTILPDLLATDLEWSPDGNTLAIASGERDRIPGETLQDGRIYLYAAASGAMRSLDGTLGALNLTWSPDGRRLAWSRQTGYVDSSLDLRVIDVETGRQRALAAPYGVVHGIGPVWSPDGQTIAFQRGFSGEHSEVVLLAPGDLSDESVGPREAVVPETEYLSSERFDPYRVAWSPDGQYLLMMAWGNPPDASGTREDPFLVAIPVDPAMPAVVLSRMDGVTSGDGYPDVTFVPIQTWGRSPTD